MGKLCRVAFLTISRVPALCAKVLSTAELAGSPSEIVASILLLRIGTYRQLKFKQQRPIRTDKTSG
jgi:hypothetical protein